MRAGKLLRVERAKCHPGDFCRSCAPRVPPLLHPAEEVQVLLTRIPSVAPRCSYVNNQRETYEFKFNGVLGPDSKQEEVFDRVARPVVLSALEGINGTVFAYGQTGSGKTFTITGGAERYVDRGIIPRTLSMIFQELSKRKGHHFQVHVSYLEIYNESGYDLLDPGREITELEDLPKVAVLEDEDSVIHFRNLSGREGTQPLALPPPPAAYCWDTRLLLPLVLPPPVACC